MEASGTIEAPSDEAAAEAAEALADAEGLEREQHDLDQSEYDRQLAAAREDEGLDAESALPTAADDDGSDVDLSNGVELQFPGLESVKLSFSGIGGKRPDESKLRVVGGAFAVPGMQFEKGQDVHVELRLRVTEVAFADTLDTKTAQATTSTRNHKGRVIGAVVVEQSTIERFDSLRDAVDGFLDGTVSKSVLAGLLGRDDSPEAMEATPPMV